MDWVNQIPQVTKVAQIAKGVLGELYKQDVNSWSEIAEVIWWI